ncbi:hypothetical protein DFJ74DRAFT_682523 [Hyaloraphidium curvatum]|nr:hypothetical protein DFJ74DRAFT_682523 [Hyaloraphidium curvatum]
MNANFLPPSAAPTQAANALRTLALSAGPRRLGGLPIEILWQRAYYNDADALCELGVRQLAGEGGAAFDIAGAAGCLSRAAELGSAEAQAWLARFQGAGYWFPNVGAAQQHEAAAVHWYSLAEQDQHLAAQQDTADGLLLAIRYDSGVGLPKEPGEPTVHYSNAATRTQPEAQLAPEGRTDDEVKRALVSVFSSTAGTRRHSEALLDRGRYFESGSYGAVDLPRALLWYHKAADRGNEEAAAAVVRLGLDEEVTEGYLQLLQEEIDQDVRRKEAKKPRRGSEERAPRAGPGASKPSSIKRRRAGASGKRRATSSGSEDGTYSPR